MQPTAVILPCGTRLHLQHGPIDLIISADGQRERAFEAATARFQSILTELVAELANLKRPVNVGTALPMGCVAQRMHYAALPFAGRVFVTRMAAVAGSVADTILEAMVHDADVSRAYVNNGGDIALHLKHGEQYATGICDHEGRRLGQIAIQSSDNIGGIATSGRHGRSLSLGIADSVTVLASNAAKADVAATLIANSVDITDHPAITRRAAHDVVEDSDLAAQPVVVGCGPLHARARGEALRTGLDCALNMVEQNHIHAAALFLQGDMLATPTKLITSHARTIEYA